MVLGVISLLNTDFAYFDCPFIAFECLYADLLHYLHNFLLNLGSYEMASRVTNMKRVNAVRSAKTAAMIEFLSALESGEGGYGGFNSFNIKTIKSGQINSYRANKILNYFDKSISKKHLAIFSKDVNYSYQLTNTDIADYLKKYDRELRFYLDFYIQSYINDVRVEFDKTINDEQD